MKISSIVEYEILNSVVSLTESFQRKKREEMRLIAMLACVSAFQNIGYEIPMYWQVNLLCGRCDRLFHPDYIKKVKEETKATIVQDREFEFKSSDQRELDFETANGAE